MTRHTPKKIEPHGPEKLEILIEWSDGKTFIVPYFEIRFLCPCAVCVDEKTGVRVLRREQVSPDVHPKGVRLVGHYAVRFDWSDQHSTGIYHHDSLYEICERKGRLQSQSFIFKKNQTHAQKKETEINAHNL